MNSSSFPEPSRPDTVRFDGRMLFLSEDATVVERQLAGSDVTLEEALPLRTDISTDEITPAYICYHYDEKLGAYLYLGLKCADGSCPVTQHGVQAGGFVVTVAGRRYGKGSSREASPFAEWCAGIRLVVAENFERIYRQNCHNIGLLGTTGRWPKAPGSSCSSAARTCASTACNGEWPR